MAPKEEKMIAIMGPTGAGKSSFIQDLVPLHLCSKTRIGHDLDYETKAIQAVYWDNEAGTRVKLVDTPGFDDSHADVTSDARILRMIATFLTNEYEGGESPLTGLIYVHPISNTQMGKTLKRNLELFMALCGLDSLKNVVIVTTMWDMVTPEEGLQHEQELSSSELMFRPLLGEGAAMMRHDRTSKSAAHIINHLLGKGPTTTLIVREIAQKNKALEETSAGTELCNGLLTRLKKHEGKIESLKDELGAVLQSDIETERQVLNGIVARLSEQFEELGRGIPGQIGIDTPLRFEPPINFPVPDTKSVIQCIKLLQLVKVYESTLVSSYPKFLSLVASRTIRFASAVEESVKDVRRGLSILRSALSSESVDAFQQFMKADPHPRSFTRGAWTKARDSMEFVANETGIMLSKLPKPGVADRVWNGRTVKRFDGLTEILESAKVVVVEVETMITWWTPVIDALENVEDAAQRMKGYTGLNDSTVKVTLSRIIRALDSYCEAYARCTEDLHKAALEILDGRSSNIPLRQADLWVQVPR